MGIEDEKVDQIIEAHAETVNALKDERDRYREAADELPKVREELERLRETPTDEYKGRYEQEHAEFEQYREQVAKADAERERGALYRKALADAGVDPRRVDAIMKVTDLSGVEVEDGALKDPGKVAEAIRSEWPEFIVQTEDRPASVERPPANSGGEREPQSLAEALRARMKG